MSDPNPTHIHATGEATSPIPAPKELPASALMRDAHGLLERELFVQE